MGLTLCLQLLGQNGSYMTPLLEVSWGCVLLGVCPAGVCPAGGVSCWVERHTDQS